MSQSQLQRLNLEHKLHSHVYGAFQSPLQRLNLELLLLLPDGDRLLVSIATAAAQSRTTFHWRCPCFSKEFQSPLQRLNLEQLRDGSPFAGNSCFNRHCSGSISNEGRADWWIDWQSFQSPLQRLNLEPLPSLNNEGRSQLLCFQTPANAVARVRFLIRSTTFMPHPHGCVSQARVSDPVAHGDAAGLSRLPATTSSRTRHNKGGRPSLFMNLNRLSISCHGN